jgi:hypothetical protein
MAPELLTIGCDPELVCRRNGEFTSARDYFKFRSSMGLDGNEEIAEIRPGYSTSPIDLTAKIRTVLEYGHEQNPELEFYAGHYVDSNPIGGHIHLGVEANNDIIDGLDIVLSSLSNVIDDEEQVVQRRESGYGIKKSYRNKSYGLEYRTPGSFLLSPTIALITFTLAKLTVVAVTEDDIKFNELKGEDHPFIFLSKFRGYLKTIPEDCEAGLDALEELLLKEEQINWDEDILPSWGLVA